MTIPVLLYFDETMVGHNPGLWHPERPDRLKAIVNQLREQPIHGTEWRTPRPATSEMVQRVHDPTYVQYISSLEGKTFQLDSDTALSPDSVPAAFLAVGAMIDAVEAVMQGDAAGAFTLVRPPGHHAERDQALGFCLFNNVAVGAEHALATTDCQRVMILDWDVHHCNGTQQAFYDRDDVLVISSHRYPFFPGTGRIDEVGLGKGRGFNLNATFPPGFGDADFISYWQQVLEMVAPAFQPDLVLVSAGYDIHVDDPLGGMLVTDEGFAALTGLGCAVADIFAHSRVVITLEGGYDLKSLAQGVHTSVAILAGERARPEPDLEDHENETVSQIIAHHRQFWPIPTP